MKIDFKKIINIKTKKDLEEFPLDKPIFQNNYLFHYLIEVGNINALKLIEFPIYIENNDNMNGFHIAANQYNEEVLYYLIKIYPEYINNRNINGETFIEYLPFEELIKIMKKFPNLDWKFLFESKKDNILKNIISNLKFNDLIQFIDLYTMEDKKCLLELVNNPNLSSSQKIKLLNKMDDINIKNDNGEGIILRAIDLDDIELFNYLIDKNIDIDYYTFIKTTSPLSKSVISDILNNRYQYTKKILERLKKENPKFYHSTNKFRDNILMTLLFARINRNKQVISNSSDYTVDMEILKLCDNKSWNQTNIDKMSPFNLLTYLDYSIYSPLIKNLKIKKEILESIVKMKPNNKWLDLFLSLETFEEKEDINIEEYDYSLGTLFQAKFTDLGVFTLYLADTYSELLIPNLTSYMINNITFDDSFPFSDDIVAKEPVFPWIINYYSSTSYYIHPYLNNIINSTRREGNKQYGIVFLSLIHDKILHANVLIYDFKNMLIERFEPYGNTSLIDDGIDDILEEELTWSTGMKYIRPKDYLPYAGFQTISDENNPVNEKMGDFGGFCLAWCLWYVETKLKNKNIESKVLVEKAIERINKMDNKFIEYIRNYSTKINEHRIKYMEKMGISKKISSNINTTNYVDNKLTNYLIKTFSNITNRQY
jgi:ankyrin repeat protein